MIKNLVLVLASFLVTLGWKDNSLIIKVFNENKNILNIIFFILTFFNLKCINLKKIDFRKYLLLFILYLYLNLLGIKGANDFQKILFYINIIGIFWNILTILEQELESSDFYLKFFLLIFGPYYLLKEKNLIRDFINDSIEIRIINFALCLFILYKNSDKIRNDIKKIKRLKLNIYFYIIEFLQKILPFYLLKDGGVKILPMLFLGSLLDRKIFEKIKKNIKIYVWLFLWILVTSVGYFLMPQKGINSKNFFEETLLVVFFIFTIIQLNWNEKIIRSGIYTFVVTSIFTVFSVIIKFSENNFILTRYGDGYLIIPFGIKYSILSIVILYLILKYKKYCLFPIFFINVFGVILSGSRGPLLVWTLLVWILILLYTNLSKTKLFIGIIIFIFIFVTINNKAIKRMKKSIEGKDSSTTARILIYKESYRQFLKSPLIGNGIGSYGTLAQENDVKQKNTSEWFALKHHTYSHNNILGLLSGVGLLGLLFYYLFQYSFLQKIYKKEEFICSLLIFICFELNGITDMTLIFFRIQEILFYIYIISLNSNGFYIRGVNYERDNFSRGIRNKTLSSYKGNK